MACVICKNTFLDVTASGEMGLGHTSLHGGCLRSKSAEPLRGEPRESPSNDMVDSQLVRLNRLLLPEPAGSHSVAIAKCRHEPLPLTRSPKVQRALSPRGASMIKMPTVASNSSISTMCPASEYGGDAFDEMEMDGANVQFELTEEEYSTTFPSQMAPATSMQFTQRSAAACLSPQYFQAQAHETPAEQNKQQSNNRKVPRTVDLAVEYERSSNADSPPTTIMIRNIPNRYSQKEIMLELEELGFADTFDFVYSPMDKCTRANLGYAFVNFVHPSFAERCMAVFQKYRFKRHREVSSKIAEASVAHLQGLEKNLAHYANTVVSSSRHKQRRPIVLTKISNMIA